MEKDVSVSLWGRITRSEVGSGHIWGRLMRDWPKSSKAGREKSGGNDKRRSFVFPSNSLRKAEGCMERSDKGLEPERCQQHPRYQRSTGEGTMWQRQPGDAVRGRGAACRCRAGEPRGGPAGASARRCGLCRGGGGPRPAMAAAAAGRRPVPAGSAPLRASRRAPPPRRCGRSSEPGKNRSRTGLRWRRGEGRWSGTRGVKLGQGIFRGGLADRWEQIAGFY